jgi:hypothetical protein
LRRKRVRDACERNTDVPRLFRTIVQLLFLFGQ